MNRRRLPTYSQGGSPLASIFKMLLLGVIIGIAYFAFDQWRTPSAPATAPTPTVQVTDAPAIPSPPPTDKPATATPVPQARLSIPTAGVNSPIVDVYLNGDSWDVSLLGNYAGHLQGTGWFGKPGNIGVAGHVELADGRPGIFARIEQLDLGDPVLLTLNQVEQRYQVTAVKRVAPDDLTVLYPSAIDQITLITCDYGSYNFLQNAYQERIVVIAERVA